MSKYPFFGKKGRPSANEREICRKINQLINSGQVSESEIQEIVKTNGLPETEEELEVLYSFLTGEESSPQETQDNGSDDLGDYSEPIKDNVQPKMANNNSGGDNPNPINFTPFEEPVIERSYTKGIVGQEEDDYSDEVNNTSDGAGVQFDEHDMQRPIDEDIPEPEWAGGFGGAGAGGEQNAGGDDEGDGEDYSDEKLGGDNLEDLSPAQKRKSAEKTAEAILNMYCNFAPLPFKKWASISDGKVQKLVFEDKIDPNMQLENNVTVKDYIDGVNEQVSDIFKVSEETREEIKDPLIDVLLEQELALTPTQRLMLAVGSHLVTMSFSAFQLAQNNKVALETFEKYHRQMNEQRKPTSTASSEPRQTASRPMPNDDSFDMNDKESVEKMMRDMGMNEDGDIIDADNDPNVEVSEDYD